MKILLMGCLISTNAMSLPLGLAGRFQLSQEANRNQVVAVEGDEATSVYAHVAKKWGAYDAKLSVTSSYRYDTKELSNSNYKVSIGINF